MLAVQLIVDQSVNGAANLIEWLNTLVDDQFDALNPVLPEEKLSGEGDELRRQQYEAKVKAFFQICGDSEDSSLIYAPLLMLPLVGDITFFQFRSAENKGTVNTLRQDAMQMLSSQKADVQQRIDNLDRLSSQLVSVSESVNKLTVPLQVKGVNFTFALSLIAKVQTALLFLTGLKPTKEQAAATAPTPETSSIDSPTDVPQNTAVEVMAQDNISVSVSQSANFSDAARTNSMNRDKAFAQLRELSEYFRVSEPHSPVSFLLEKAIRWGYMSLPELMTELMSDRKNEQDKIFNLIGLDNEEQVSLPSSASGTSTTQSTSNSAQEQQAASEPKAKPQESTNKTSSGSTGLRW
ncbi:type VI secretion system protein TssA [Enterovibrio coralii]|uniref:ImpA N-terminal domain-containing protein n=1 Tax=Enterovibrio coralii TaxID=294935 RepID=A0A135IDD6_9GAMM|nr:hypothetical protein [Enterovibrio coralii]KXF83487.1 hypothetical protein ATN88_16525 [Enterovibrio coralii]